MYRAKVPPHNGNDFHRPPLVVSKALLFPPPLSHKLYVNSCMLGVRRRGGFRKRGVGCGTSSIHFHCPAPRVRPVDHALGNGSKLAMGLQDQVHCFWEQGGRRIGHSPKVDCESWCKRSFWTQGAKSRLSALVISKVAGCIFLVQNRLCPLKVQVFDSRRDRFCSCSSKERKIETWSRKPSPPCPLKHAPLPLLGFQVKTNPPPSSRNRTPCPPPRSVCSKNKKSFSKRPLPSFAPLLQTHLGIDAE